MLVLKDGTEMMGRWNKGEYEALDFNTDELDEEDENEAQEQVQPPQVD